MGRRWSSMGPGAVLGEEGDGGELSLSPSRADVDVATLQALGLEVESLYSISYWTTQANRRVKIYTHFTGTSK